MATAEEIAARLRSYAAERIRDLTINVQAGLMAETPVDTGFAAANWQITIGAPATGTVAMGAGVAVGASVLADYQLADGSTFVTNNAPYIRRLNGGHSKQAPAGFVEAVVAREVAR